MSLLIDVINEHVELVGNAMAAAHTVVEDAASMPDDKAEAVAAACNELFNLASTAMAFSLMDVPTDDVPELFGKLLVATMHKRQHLIDSATETPLH